MFDRLTQALCPRRPADTPPETEPALSITVVCPQPEQKTLEIPNRVAQTKIEGKINNRLQEWGMNTLKRETEKVLAVAAYEADDADNATSMVGLAVSLIAIIISLAAARPDTMLLVLGIVVGGVGLIWLVVYAAVASRSRAVAGAQAVAYYRLDNGEDDPDTKEPSDDLARPGAS